MPQLRLGTTFVSNVKLGTTQVSKAMRGTTEVWAAGQAFIGSAATLSVTARSSTWGPALVPSGRSVHWDASHEASFTYHPDTNLVSQWNDLSGNGWYLVEASDREAPAREIGFNDVPIVHFTDYDFMWRDPAVPANFIHLAQPITTHIVASTTPYPGNGSQFVASYNFAAVRVHVRVDGTIMFAAGSSAEFPFNTRDRHLITAVFNGASSVQRIDGVQVGTGNPGTGELDRVQIGISHTVADMEICEIVHYNRVLTGPEITYNEDLLRQKWFMPPGIWLRSPATVTVEASARTWFTGAAPAFRPDDIETCLGWWDASDASTFTFGTGASVAQWRDKSAAAHHLSAPTTPEQPDRTGTINALSTVTFDGSAFMDIAGYTVPSQPYTVFVVGAISNVTPGAGDYGIIGGARLGTDLSISRRESDQLLWVDASIGTSFALDTNPHVIGVVFDREKSQQRIDGDRVGTVNTGGAGFLNFRVGIGTHETFGMVGQVAEVVLYNRRLNATEIDEVETYLSDKWIGPPLPQTWTGSSATATITATSGTWGLPSAPGAPTLTAATPGNTTVTLAWTAGTTGGSTITGYTVEKSPNGTTSWTSAGTPTASPHTVTGLTNGTIQYFRVSATNAIGTGTPSNVLSATPSPPLSWTEDYSDDTLAVATQWTMRNGYRLGVFDFSGTRKLAVCHDVNYEYVDYYFSKCSHNTAVATTQAQTFRAEVEFAGTGSNVILIVRANADRVDLQRDTDPGQRLLGRHRRERWFRHQRFVVLHLRHSTDHRAGRRRQRLGYLVGWRHHPHHRRCRYLDPHRPVLRAADGFRHQGPQVLVRRHVTRVR